MEDKLLDKLEAVRRSRPSPADEEAWATFVQTHPEATTIAADYERLWAGLAALRSTQFLTQLQSWEAEWTDYDDAELAEWFVEGELHEANAAAVTQRSAVEPEFAQLIDEQRQLSTGFSALKNDQLRGLMQEWDTEQEPPERAAKVVTLQSRWFTRLLVAASILLLILAGTELWDGRRLAEQQLAESYYKIPTIGNTMGDGAELNDYLQQFQMAHERMQEYKYQAATDIFRRLSTVPPPAALADDIIYYQENIEWNLLLARLGIKDTGGDFTVRLSFIADNPEHLFSKQAQALREDLAR
ncbi:MAG: hypothetical protein AAGJ82_14650 [Bacteroidota bacterium]